MSSKLVILFFLLQSGALYSQSMPDSFPGSISANKFKISLEKRLSRLEVNILLHAEKTLQRLQKQEERIYKIQLATNDSLQLRSKLAEVQNKYKAMLKKLKNPSSVIGPGIGQYVPHLDTLNVLLKLLDHNHRSGDFNETLSKIESLNDNFQKAQEIKDFIRERGEVLKEELERRGLLKQLKQFNKQVYQYVGQLKEYKETIGDPSKIEKESIALLSKTKAFRDFMRENSMLASLFHIPGDTGDDIYSASFTTLQTRAQVNNLIGQQLAIGGLNAQVQFQQNVQQAQSQMWQLKDKLMPSGGSSDDIMPEGFKPRDQKTESFLKRLEYGTNIQAQRSTNFFPATTDLGLSIGYKLNERSIIGIGASYKVGLGRGWNHMELSSQGAGLRSYVDWKLKGSIWVSGGYEMNYKSQLDGIRISTPFGRHPHAIAWSRSGLLGLSKVFDVKSKVFKRTKVQLLWDFLSYDQIPRTQAVIFRVGYNLK